MPESSTPHAPAGWLAQVRVNGRLYGKAETTGKWYALDDESPHPTWRSEVDDPWRVDALEQIAQAQAARDPNGPTPELPYVYRMVFGDWSHDGHGETETVRFRTNTPVTDIRWAYIQACKQFGVALHGLSADPELKITPGTIQHRAPGKYHHVVSRLGTQAIAGLTGMALEDDTGLVEFYRDVFLWLVHSQIADFRYEIIVPKEPEAVFGYWTKGMNISLGYEIWMDDRDPNGPEWL